MVKNLTIMKGDEYRAKIEQKFAKNDFFEEVYIEAQDIVKEIVLEIEEYCRQEKERGGFRIKYQGMGNNIILFCAGRGQGKTSAMQSFANYLRGMDADEELKKYYFHVLESIDPTALDGKESILRVLIARLFSEYEKAVSDKRFEDVDEREFKKDNAALLELFQQCFINIDYLKGEKERDEGQDDLEYLAQLGNSAVLKTNLQKLVEQFLKLTCSTKSCYKTNYLVVQIDDVDLSIVDIFGICEDIRNYLSIPNVIILLAADYENLRDAVYKKYLEDNRIFWSEMEDAGRKAEYNTMASKYMEKVFPSGHRINLPQIDDALARGEDAIHISYQKASENGKELLSDEVMQCKELQEQLFLVIYRKTGAVFLKPEEGMHPFLPHTLRQLTHFLKLLSDMEEIDFMLAYRAANGAGKQDELSDKEVVKLKHNIRSLKSYFLDYWCASRLSYEESKIICRMEEVCKKKNRKKLCHFIEQTFGFKMRGNDNDVNTYSYQNLIYRIRNSGDKLSENLRDAIEIFFTIFFNEWFIRALREHKQYQKIKRFLGMSLDFPWYIGPKKLFFNASVKELNKFNMDLKEGQSLRWLQTFCVPVDNEGNELESMVVGSSTNAGTVFDENVSMLKFDALHAVLAVFDLDRAGDSMDDGNGEENESVSDQKAEQKESQEGAKINESLSLFISAKNILLNTDVQRYLGSKMHSFIKKYANENYIMNWNAVCRTIYEIFDSWTGQAEYLKEKSVMQEVGMRDIKDSSVWEQLYVCSENKSYAIENYKEDTMRQLNKIENILKQANECMEKGSDFIDELMKCLVEGLLEGELEKFKYKMNEFSKEEVNMRKMKEHYDGLVQLVNRLNSSKMEDGEMLRAKEDIKRQISSCYTDLDALEQTVRG